MNLRFARRQWRWLLVVLSIGIVGGLAATASEREVPAAIAAPAPVVAAGSSPEAPRALPRREAPGKLRSDPFAARAWTAPPAPAPVEAPVEVERALPPNPYRFAGTVQQGGRVTVVLTEGERIHLVKPGELLNGVYRLAAVSPGRVTLVYLPLGLEQQLAHIETEPAPAPPPADPALARNLADTRP